MSCKEYIAYLTSDRLHQLAGFKKLRIKSHLLVCKGCRNFTNNDAAIIRALKKRRAWLDFI